MAGQATVVISVKVTGLGDDVSFSNSQTMTVPTDYQSGYTVVGTSGVQLFDSITHIALIEIYGVYLKAVADKIYIAVDTAGTTAVTTTTADLILNEGEACYLPINEVTAGAALGLVLTGDAATSACQWLVLGSGS